MSPEHSKPTHTKLGPWLSTAICGNDILSSTLYVSGIAIIFAGVYAPLVLLFIGVVLYLYKAVYTEVVEALPVNGGAYNCLLNGTSKTFAAVAGVMTILSYVATSVISAKVGVEYLNTILHFIPIIPATIGLLLLFALLVISGLKDSAKVAFGIFVFHVVTLVVVVAVGAYYYLSGGHSYFAENWVHTGQLIKNQGNLLMTLYLAFSASLLGVSGFESSANFVEEQKKGVFRLTLRNMLLGVVVFNPLIALVVLNSMPFEAIAGAKDFLLAEGAQAIGGSFLQILVGVDAFMVLSGAVLTSFVGVSGLVSRMAGDNCLPNFLSKMNAKGSYPRIIISFFLLCSSILLITGGNLLSLAGVYTISFLGVMSFFAFGNIILKETRTELKRTYHAPLLFVIIAFTATVLGIIGNIRIDVNNLHFFELYFIPSIMVVLFVIYQDYVIKFALKMTAGFPKIHHYLRNKFSALIEGRFIVFVHNTERLHSVLDYINRNETGWHITLIHCKDDLKNGDHNHGDVYKELENSLPVLKKAGVFPHFNLKLEYLDVPFGPDAIEKVAQKYNISKSRMFIGSIHHHHPYDYDELGGVRIIF